MSHDPRFFPPQPPIPVQPISYRAYTRQSKPGILTAVGILSIVLACISFAAGTGGALMALGFVVMGSRVMLPPPPLPPPASNVVVSGTAIVSSEDALPRGPMLLIGNILARKRDMSDRQLEQLKALLSQAGKRIFPFETKSLTPELIRNNITESGSIPGIGNSGGSTYFIVGTGRIEVYEDHATFRPDESMDVVSVRAGDNTSTQAPVPPPATAPVTFGPMPAPKVNVPIAMGIMIENGLSVLLSLFLLIAGILMLRGARSARRMHWIYVWIKIPLVILAAVFGIFFYRSFVSVSNSPAPPMAMPLYIFGVVFAAAVALAYPIALIFVLMSRGVRQCFGAEIQ